MTGHSHHSSSRGSSFWNKIKSFAKSFWGDFESKQEVIKFILLGLVFFFVIGTYWTLRPLKDSLFNEIIGFTNQPWAKILSMFVIFPLVIFYSKLIDLFSRDRVFYSLIAFYAILAGVFFAIFHYHPEYGLAVVKKSDWTLMRKLIGYGWYVYVESFGSIIVALFWAIASDVTMPDAGKRGFPIVVLLGQLGNVICPLVFLSKQFQAKYGLITSAPVVAICAGLMACAALVLFFFMKTTPKHLLKGYHGKDEAKVEKEQEPGFLEGLKILLSHGYLLGIFFIVMVFEIIVTFLDFHFKATVMTTFDTELARSAYLGDYAVWVGIVAFASLLLGIARIPKWVGMRAALFLLPLLLAVVVVLLNTYATALGVILCLMVFSKAVNYALNQPTLKQLYIPTTHDTKYKAQAWGDMFGSRGAKAGVSLVNKMRDSFFIPKFGALQGIVYFISMMTAVSAGLIGVWFLVAYYIARTYDKAIKENRVVC
jgi:AAA family ATP:ADP antiporter